MASMVLSEQTIGRIFAKHGFDRVVVYYVAADDHMGVALYRGGSRYDEKLPERFNVMPMSEFLDWAAGIAKKHADSKDASAE